MNTNFTSLIECPVDQMLGKMALIPIGTVEKTNVLVLRSILSRLLSGSQNSLRKSDAVQKWQELVSDYQLQLSASIRVEKDSRQRLTSEIMENLKPMNLEQKKVWIVDNLEGLATTTIKSEFSFLRQYLKGTVDYPDRDALIVWSYEYSRPFTLAANKQVQTKLGETVRNVQDVSESAIKQWVMDRKDSEKWQDQAMIVAICTGRRSVEILGNKSTFTPTSEHTIAFSGQAKKRDGWDMTPFEIPVIFLTSDEVCSLIDKLDKSGKRIEVESSKTINLAYSKPLSRHPKPFPEFKSSRDFYVAYLIHHNHNRRITPMVYASEVLGHNVADTGLSSAAINYQKYRIVP